MRNRRVSDVAALSARCRFGGLGLPSHPSHGVCSRASLTRTVGSRFITQRDRFCLGNAGSLDRVAHKDDTGLLVQDKTV